MKACDSRFILAQLNVWTERYRKAIAAKDAAGEIHAGHMCDIRFEELRDRAGLTPQAPCDHAARSSQEGDKNG